ncbi:MAG: DegT/DnrJ/EryC1/StrS aminotransferase family protein [Flavobacteriaceae bacterium]|nr:DegT/DnrJ/EryC1/StrS aminotransferase family protein [Flavobacteriaceae bacterium]
MDNFKIPLYKPTLNSNEKKYVIECLDEGWISSKGKFVEKFEDKFSEYLNIKYSITCANGTTALHLALLSLGIGPGDEVLVPSLTYVASVNAITYCGAKPIFIDSNKDDFQLNPLLIRNSLTKNTKAVLAVHLYSSACELDLIKQICEENNLFLIEDCAESLGTKYKNEFTGTFGHVSTFSFYGNKTISTGEGGMVCTNDANIAKKVMLYKGQGLDIESEKYYSHIVVGYNYRMTNICAAIGLAQLEQLDNILVKKREIAAAYFNELNNIQDIRFQNIDKKNISSSFWLVSITCKNLTTRNDLMQYLSKKNIETRPFFIPMNELNIYKDYLNSTPISSYLSSVGLNLPSYPELSIEEITHISSIIRSFFE